MMLMAAALTTRVVKKIYSAPPDHCSSTNGRLKKNASWCTACNNSLSMPWGRPSKRVPITLFCQIPSVSSNSQLNTSSPVSTAASQGCRSTRK